MSVFREITFLGGIIFFYEVLAKAIGLPTWTRLTAEHDLRALPCWAFAGWLFVHLIRAWVTGRD